MKAKSTESQGIRLLRELSASGRYIFTSENAVEAAQSQKIPLSQLNKILSNLAIKGWALRLRRGLYASTGSLPGKIHVHPFAIATHLIQPSAISHWSAMQHHGLIEQVPQIITAVTPSKVITPSMRAQASIISKNKKHAWEINGLRYEYITIQKKYFYGIEEIWMDEYFRIPITDKERTLLDGFIFSKMFGGMGEILGILEAAIPSIDIKKFIEYAIRYGEQSLIKRVGWSLEHFNVPAKYLNPLLKIPANYYCLLDSSMPVRGSRDHRWKIQNNLSGRYS